MEESHRLLQLWSCYECPTEEYIKQHILVNVVIWHGSNNMRALVGDTTSAKTYSTRPPVSSSITVIIISSIYIDIIIYITYKQTVLPFPVSHNKLNICKLRPTGRRG